MKLSPLSRKTPLKVNTRPRKRNAPRPAEKSALGYLKWLRGRECVVCCMKGYSSASRIEAAHVDYAGGKGVGTKVADKHAIPMCGVHHAEQHSLGWNTFEGKYRFNAADFARQFWKAWPGRGAWEAKNGA